MNFIEIFYCADNYKNNFNFRKKNFYIIILPHFLIEIIINNLIKIIYIYIFLIMFKKKYTF